MLPQGLDPILKENGQATTTFQTWRIPGVFCCRSFNPRFASQLRDNPGPVHLGSQDSSVRKSLCGSRREIMKAHIGLLFLLLGSVTASSISSVITELPTCAVRKCPSWLSQDLQKLTKNFSWYASRVHSGTQHARPQIKHVSASTQHCRQM